VARDQSLWGFGRLKRHRDTRKRALGQRVVSSGPTASSRVRHRHQEISTRSPPPTSPHRTASRVVLCASPAESVTWQSPFVAVQRQFRPGPSPSSGSTLASLRCAARRFGWHKETTDTNLPPFGSQPSSVVHTLPAVRATPPALRTGVQRSLGLERPARCVRWSVKLVDHRSPEQS